jgi:nucleoside-diphosphate-sugar epimerase
MRILVTGASGFIGSHLVSALLAAGHQVAGLTRNPNELPAAWDGLPIGVAEPTGRGVRQLCSDFRPDVVVHLAALYVSDHRYDDIAPLIQANLLLGLHLLDAMAESGCNAMVWAGTSWQHYEKAQYKPANLYAATKQAFSTLAEYYLDACGLRLVELHLYDSYGENDHRPRLLNLLQSSALNRQVLALSGGKQRLHLVHIDDVVAGFVAACDAATKIQPGQRRIYRLPAKTAVSLRELVAAFDAADPESPAYVEWGARPYRAREVFTPWEDAEVLPGWQPKVELQAGLARLRHCKEMGSSYQVTGSK